MIRLLDIATVPHRLPALLALAAAATLGAALVFEHGFGYAPCTLCHWQRVPYYAALGLVLPPLAAGRRAVAPTLAVAGLLFFGGAAVAGFHVGVEQHWWQGPSTCSGGAFGGDPAAALEQILAARVIRCDDVAWSFLGISMAGWNLLIASTLGLLAWAGFRRRGELCDER